MKTTVKIAYVGGGSRYWAPMLFQDLALEPALDGEIALYDCDLAAAKQNAQLATSVFSHPDARTTFQATVAADLATALRDANFVVLSILPGPIEMMASDLDVPAEYGILQTVGDTTGPGGIVRALRTIPQYEAFAEAIMEHCPQAWVINYTNPMTLCTAALYEVAPQIRAFGCCHEVFGTQSLLAEQIVEKILGFPRPPRQQIVVDVCGVNHFTFLTGAQWDGRDLFPAVWEKLESPGLFDDRTEQARERVSKGQWFGSADIVKFDFLRRFGVLGAAGDRHLVEFVPWYLRDEATLHRWGVVRTPSSFRVSRYRTESRETGMDPSKTLRSSGEEGVEQMKALLGLGNLDTNVNLPNGGQMPQMPLGVVVETNAQFRKNSLVSVVASPLPEGVAEHVRRVSATQSLTLEAAFAQDRDLALQAMLSDPLVHLSTDAAAEMLDKMLANTREALPSGWFS